MSQLHQRSTKHQPQRDAHNTDQHVGVLLQAGAQSQTEGQLQQQGRQVPQPPLHALLAIPGVKIRLAATGHLHDQHEDEDGVKSPNGKEDQKPVPVDFGVQLEDQHNEKDQGKYPGKEDTLSQGHLHLWRGSLVWIPRLQRGTRPQRSAGHLKVHRHTSSSCKASLNVQKYRFVMTTARHYHKLKLKV